MARAASRISGQGAAFAFLLLFAAAAAAQNAEEKLNMALVGHHDLSARSAYQPTVQSQGGRWIAYVGHHGGASVNPLTARKESNGTSILDVTDPKQPRLLSHIPGEPGAGESGGAQMVRVCTGLPKVPGRTFMLRSFGNAVVLRSGGGGVGLLDAGGAVVRFQFLINEFASTIRMYLDDLVSRLLSFRHCDVFLN